MGQKRTRDIKIEKYKNGLCPVLFLNSNFNGAGINLQETTDIIFYHEMPNDNREQNIGRAMRVGKKRSFVRT